MAEFTGNREMRDQVLALLLSGQKTTSRSRRRAVSPPPTRRPSDPWTPGTHLTPFAGVGGLSPVTPDGGSVPTDADVRLAEITAGLVAASDKERRQTDTIRRLALHLELSEREIRDLNARGEEKTPIAGKERRASRRSKRDTPPRDRDRDLQAELDSLRREKRDWKRRDSASRKEARDVMALLADIRRSSQQVLAERDGHLRVIATLQQQLYEASRNQAQPRYASGSPDASPSLHAEETPPPAPVRRSNLSRAVPPSPQLPASLLTPPSPSLPPPSPSLPPAPRRVLRHGSPLSERVPRVSGELLSRTGSLPDFTRVSSGARSKSRQREDSFPTLDISRNDVPVFDESRGAAYAFKEVRAGGGAFDGGFDSTYPRGSDVFEDEMTVSVGDVFENVPDIADTMKDGGQTTENHPESETPPRNAHTVAQLYKDLKELLNENRDLRDRLKRSDQKNTSEPIKPASPNAVTPTEAAARLCELDDELRVLEGVVECLEFSIDTEQAERLQLTMSTVDYDTRTLRNDTEGDTGTERGLVDRLQAVVQRVADIRMQIADKYGKFLADFGSPADPDETVSLPPGDTLDSLPDTDISLSRTVLAPPDVPLESTTSQPGSPPPLQ